MPRFSLCNNKFQIDDPQLVDPRADSSFQSIDPEDWAEVIRQNFDEPLDFPPIPQAVMSEDTIAIAVEPDTPCGLKIARLVADRFVAMGNDRQRITILCAQKEPDAGDDCVFHDPADSDQMAFLVGDREGVPFYVNRILFDADIVVPIGTGDGGRFNNVICPVYCDVDTRAYFDRLRPDDAAAVTRMVNSNLGVFWQVRIVTAPGDNVIQVMVGSSDAVLQKSGQLGTEVWNLQIDRPAGMVLATIESPSAQNWENLRRAILTADKAASGQASLVMCTDLRGKPPASWPTPDNDSKKRDADLFDVFQRRHVYLASRLTQDSTEQYGFGHVDNSEQVQKLIDQHESCLLLRDAHRVGLHITETV